MDIYLLKSTVILAIFWVLYVLFLEKENMHRFKRFYLLTSIVAAFCIPLLSITQYVYVEPIDGINFRNEAIPFLINDSLQVTEIPFWTLERILWSVYGLGVFIFGIRFLSNLFKIVKTIQVNEKEKQSFITLVLLKQLINPHTFFNYIFLNKSKFESNAVPKEVLLHEETHAKQKHSLDILFIELIQVVFWFQPFIWLYKKRIKLNHEFLADQAVVDKGFESANYQNTLLSYSSNQDYSLSNAIHYSSIKKRFTVMKTQTSKHKKWLLSLLILPVLGILFYSFSEREIVEIEVPFEEISAQTNENDGVSKTLMNEYISFIKKYNETRIIYGEAYERAIIIYDQLMSDTQRASVEKYPERIIPKPNLSKVNPRKLTNKLYEDFKDSDTYAIWIDGKHIQNSALNNYSASDFVHYSGSIVHKNARNKKFPQPNQYHLYTKAGFKATYQDSQLKRYNKATEAYSNAIKTYLKGNQTDNSELIILKAKADDIYKTFSATEIKTNNIRTAPPVPVKKISHTARSISIKVLDDGSYLVDGKKVSKKSLVATVNQLHQDVTSEVRNKIINIHLTFADKESNDEVWFIYNSLLDYGFHRLVTKNQEVIRSKGNTPFLDNKNSEKQQKLPTVKEVAEFNVWAKKINSETKTISGNTKHLPIVDEKKLIKYAGIYNRMSAQQKKNAEEMPFPGFENIKGAETSISISPKANQQNLPTAKEVAEYNAWAKKLKKETLAAKENPKLSYPIVKQKDLIRYISIYKRMTPKQRENSAELPIADEELKATGLKFPPPPPPVKQKNPPTVKEVADYNAWAKKMNTQISKAKTNKKAPYPIIKKKDIVRYKSIYGRMTEKQRTNAEAFPSIPPPPPPPPPAPKKTKSKGGPNANDIVFNDYSPIDLAIDLAKKNTTYYLNSKSISKEEALKLLNADKNVHVQNIEPQSDTPTVLISKKIVTINNKAGIPKPTSKNIVNHIKVMNRHGAKFYLDNTNITYKEALKYVRKNKNADVRTSTESNVVIINVSLVNNYLKKYNRYQALRKEKPHYINKNKTQQKEMDDLFSELGSLYFRMSKENKAKVKRPTPPVLPYVKISLNGKTYYKKSKDLTKEERATLPPPPPPPLKKHN
ncbi:M56 family metallopeptidase [uncultured Winogradskyella sp.]|uniref:M56 family metallopeptidase n=1 Tax=uncultured Winogradskyella sp. TaxID=395353 RepID=UPI0026275F2D|nr:M56 family metallopeptidase [uncultured Winogradskyella sp.]